MISWNKLPKEVQRAILALVVVSGGTTVSSCCPVIADPLPPPSITPVICDPPPPPATITPTKVKTPIICDPPPPPATVTPTKSRTPMICDPLPPPSATPKPVMSPIICDAAPPPPRTPTAIKTPMICDPTPAPPTVAVPYFQVRSMQISSDPKSEGGLVIGTVRDRNGQSVGGVRVTITTSEYSVETETTPQGIFRVPAKPGLNAMLVIGNDPRSSISLQLKEHDIATIEFVQVIPSAQLPQLLPLAEIRLVDIVWGDDLTFTAESPWTGAYYRWSVSGGALVEEAGRVTWQPPTEPGHYLLQVIADWGQAGLAVDVLTLAVTDDGTVVVV